MTRQRFKVAPSMGGVVRMRTKTRMVGYRAGGKGPKREKKKDEGVRTTPVFNEEIYWGENPPPKKEPKTTPTLDPFT